MLNQENIICNFFISNKFEAINFNYGLDGFTEFELLGLSQNKYQQVGNLFFNIFNNYNIIIQTLEKSKKYLNAPLYDLLNYINKTLTEYDKYIAKIITKELNIYYTNETINIRENQAQFSKIQGKLKEYKEILNNTNLYNKYYDDLINEAQEIIATSQNQEEIDDEKDFLKDLYEEKNDSKKGKKVIRSYIADLEEDEKESFKELRNLDELPSLMDKYIERLINTIINYKYYFDLYFGISNLSDLKGKDMSYFQSLFSIDFEIPRQITYAIYKKNDTYFPLKNLVFSIYKETKDSNETVESLNDIFSYEKILNTTNNLHKNKNIFYLKSYAINNLKDILNIYFNYFTQENIHIKKCKNCNKYFIPQNRTDEVYCNNPSPQNPNKTCKEYGAKKTYRDEIKSQPLKSEHNKTSQFYRMRINRAKNEKEKSLYKKKFNAYKEQYQTKKEQYKKGKLKEADFIEWIIKQKEGGKNGSTRNNKK